jgi:hypothetical protein
MRGLVMEGIDAIAEVWKWKHCGFSYQRKLESKLLVERRGKHHKK